MSENLLKINVYKFGNFFGALALIIALIIAMIKQQPFELILLFVFVLIYFIFKYIYYFNLLKHKNYVEIEVKCIGNHHPSIGYGLTNSMIFDFEAVDSKGYNIENNKIELQVATTPKITKKGIRKYPYIQDQYYLMMFKVAKNNQTNFDNRNYLTSCTINNSDERGVEDNTKNEKVVKNISEK